MQPINHIPGAAYVFLDTNGKRQFFNYADLCFLGMRKCALLPNAFILDIQKGDGTKAQHVVMRTTFSAIRDAMHMTDLIYTEPAPHHYAWTAPKREEKPAAPAKTAVQFEAARGADEKVYQTVQAAMVELFDAAVTEFKSPDFRRDFATALSYAIGTLAAHIAQREIHNERMAGAEAFKKFVAGPLGETFRELKEGLNVHTVHVDAADADKVMRELRETGMSGFTIDFQPSQLNDDALACLQDVVSHYSDFADALTHRVELAKQEDMADQSGLSEGPRDANTSYWLKQRGTYERMYEQAQRALAAHAKVTQ